ncbi:unnamed protein product [Somion occarium]
MSGRGRGNRPKQTARRGGTPMHTGDRTNATIRLDDNLSNAFFTGVRLEDEPHGSEQLPELPPGFPHLFSTIPDNLHSRLPSLKPAAGPPIIFEGMVGGAMFVNPELDPRLHAVSMGFPISVHPLRLPNTRAQFASGSTVSVIDYRFLRLSGLLHEMVPLRPGVDQAKLLNNDGSRIAQVWGKVEVVFDAQGYEFKETCWVINIGFPVDIQFGIDWARQNGLVTNLDQGNFVISSAKAKKVRNLQDIYVTR